MTEKRLCVIDSCDYCPFFEKLEIKGETKNNFLIDADFYKCNKTKLCVEAHNINIEQPKKVLFNFCPLPNEEQKVSDPYKPNPIGRRKSKKNGWDSEPNTDYVTRVKEMLNDE